MYSLMKMSAFTRQLIILMNGNNKIANKKQHDVKCIDVMKLGIKLRYHGDINI